MRVFVSSRISDDELSEERQVAYETLRKWCEPVMFEYSPAAPQHFRDWWRERIPTCDLFVLLLHRTMRWAVFDELETARDHLRDASVLVLVKEAEITRRELLKVECDEEGKPRLDEGERARFYDFLKSWKQGEFGGATELAAALSQAIREVPGADLELPERMRKLVQVFVPPDVFDECIDTLRERRILVLTGPPHVGKTAMALMLLEHLRTEGTLGSIRWCRKAAELEGAAKCGGLGILADDPFGGSTLQRPDLADDSLWLERIKAANLLVVTSREDVLRRAAAATRWGESAERWPQHTLSADSYSYAARVEVLDRHCEYMLREHIPESERLSEQQAEWARERRDHLARQLRFPHNIDVFARHYLPRAGTPGELLAFADQALEIEKAVRDWFGGLSEPTQLALCVAALLPDVREEHFRGLLTTAATELSLPAVDLGASRSEAAAYVGGAEALRFRHPSYRTGVVMALHGAWADRAVRVGDVLVRTLAEEDVVEAARALEGIPRLEFAREWAKDEASVAQASARAHRVVHRLATEVATALQAVHAVDEGGATLVWPALDPSRHIVVWLAPRPAEAALPAMPTEIQTLVRAMPDHMREAHEWRVISRPSSATSRLDTPEGVAFEYALGTVRDLVDRRRLSESWHLLWARAYEDLRLLVQEGLLPDESLSEAVTARALKGLLRETVTISSAGERQEIPLDGLLLVFGLHRRVNLGRLLSDLEQLEACGRGLAGPLLAQPDWGDAERGPVLTAEVFTDDLLIAGARQFLTYLLEAHVEMCRRNFPGLLTGFPLCPHLPCDIYARVERPADPMEEWNPVPADVCYTLWPPADEAAPTAWVILRRGGAPVAGDLEAVDLIEERIGEPWGLVSGAIASGSIDAYEVVEGRCLRDRTYASIDRELREALGAWYRP